jgi:hypothetical protein
MENLPPVSLMPVVHHFREFTKKIEMTLIRGQGEDDS